MNIKNLHKVDFDPTVAFFSVEWEGKMTVHDCRLIKTKDGRLFASMPQKKPYVDKKTGQTKYDPLVYVEQDLLKKISVAAEAEYQSLTGTNRVSQSTQTEDIPF